jgi:hypothetical protein
MRDLTKKFTRMVLGLEREFVGVAFAHKCHTTGMNLNGLFGVRSQHAPALNLHAAPHRESTNKVYLPTRKTDQCINGRHTVQSAPENI